jgi:hypothetical protein
LYFFDEALTDFENLRPAKLVKFDDENVPQMPTFEAKNFLTACKNYVVLRIIALFERHFALIFGALSHECKTDFRKKFAVTPFGDLHFKAVPVGRGHMD